VLRDAKKAAMSKHAVGKLEEAMQRVELGIAKPGEIGKVRGEILELRVNQDKRWYRLLFARDEGGYVALLLGAKKTNQMQDGWIDTAEERLGEHRQQK
jgi:putative component of toxin-antitoxin plasmid stabilization module